MSENQKALEAREFNPKHLESRVYELMAAYAEAEGEITVAVDATELAFQKDLDFYLRLAEEFKFRAAWIAQEKAKLYEQEKRFERAADRIDEQLKSVMHALGTTEIEGEVRRVKMMRTRPSLKIDHNQIPEEYKKQTIVVEPDKDKIRSALDVGLYVPGARYEESAALRKSFRIPKGGNL